MNVKAGPTGRSSGLLAFRVIWGVVLLVTPGRALALLGGADDGHLARGVMRILGARHLLEAVAERRYGRRVRAIAAAVDGVHAASAVGFAVVDRRWRRAALADAAVATAFAVMGTLEPTT